MSSRASVERIVAIVAREYAIEPELVFGRSRVQQVAEARQMAIYCVRRRMFYTYKMLGGVFGRSFSTICYSVRLMQNWVKKDKITREHYERILKIFRDENI